MKNVGRQEGNLKIPSSQWNNGKASWDCGRTMVAHRRVTWAR